MKRMIKFASRKLEQCVHESEGSQLVELAVSLPLLVLFMLGIVNFGQAYRLKHQLDIASQEAARVASNQTAADITGGNPDSTDAVRAAVSRSLSSMNIDDCGLSAAVPTKVKLAWTYNSTGSCPGQLTLVVDRGFIVPTTGGTPTAVESTRVFISYPYSWSFDRIMRFFSGSFALPGQISSDATSPNLT